MVLILFWLDTIKALHSIVRVAYGSYWPQKETNKASNLAGMTLTFLLKQWKGKWGESDCTGMQLRCRCQMNDWVIEKVYDTGKTQLQPWAWALKTLSNCGTTWQLQQPQAGILAAAGLRMAMTWKPVEQAYICPRTSTASCTGYLHLPLALPYYVVFYLGIRTLGVCFKFASLYSLVEYKPHGGKD